MNHVYNVRRQEKDKRDLRFRVEPVWLSLPSKIDLRPDCPPVFDQGELGSCTANAGVAARMMLGRIRFMLSRLFLYYKERELTHTESTDSGATMRDICRALHKYGVCRELYWPYIISNFDVEPPRICDRAAKKLRITAYRSFDHFGPDDQISQIKQYLAVKRLPVLAGVTIYESFESKETEQTGVIPVPDPQTEKELGGHALLMVGYDDKAQQFIIRNSWGKAWGDAGYGYMPYDFVRKGFAYDFWVIE